MLAGTVIGGVYENYEDSYMTSPSINLSGLTSIKLTLQSWEYFEKSFDFGYIQVSSNNGVNWTQLYKTDTVAEGWNPLSFDITSHRSSQFRMRFYLHTDISIQRGGWSLDDIQITGIPEETVALDEAFDTPPAGWNLEGSWETGPAQGGYEDPTTDASGVAGGMLAGTSIGGPHDAYEDSSMTSPTYDLTHMSSALLTFQSWEDIEWPSTNAFVEVSTNGGVTWQPLYSITSPKSHWKHHSFDVSAYTSSNFRVRFRLVSNGSVGHGGWSLDHIRIAGVANTLPVDTLFSDSFSTPTNTNWIVEAPWDIGSGVEFVGDPTYDTTPSPDNGLAGTVIGGSYGNSVNSSLISKRLNTRGWKGLKLQFNSWEHFEPNKDFGRVLVSTNDGAS